MADTTKNQRADKALDDYIERRAREAKGKELANAQALSWGADQRRRTRLEQESNRLEWYDHFCHLAEHHAALAEENRQKADALISSRS